MGQNKALMLFNGLPLIQRVADRLSPIAAELNVISNEASDYQFLNLPVFPDQLPGKGVLGGIYTALFVGKHPFVAPVGCDLPFISSRLLNAELKMILKSDVDIIIPESVNGLEPLHAVYRKSTCLLKVEKSIEDGELRIISWFDNAKVRVLTSKELKEIDSDPAIFLNLNRPEEFQQAVEREE